VFCDVVGSTELSTKLDPEELGEITARYHEAVVNVVERYGGEVVRYLGDGVLIEFGWPVAHDDDCERAVRTAIEVAAAVESVDRDLPQEVTLAARIGVHTGPVLVGELGGGAHRQRMALGETMNIAARLQESAAPGTAVISETTRRLVRGIFVTEELEPKTLKGLPQPMRVHRVIQPAGVPSRFDDAGGMLSPYVGRNADLQSLLDIWRDTNRGRGRAVLISGEPGVGKSRLVHELRQIVKDQPHSWLECRCSSYNQPDAFRPMIELLERGLGFQSKEKAEERLARLERALDRTGIDDTDAVAVLAPLFSLSARTASPPLEPDLQRHRTHELILRWAHALASLQPLLLLVEDLQWADPSTLEVFRRLSESLSGTRVMLIGTARHGFRPSWADSASVSQIGLAPLSNDEVRALVARIVNKHELPEPVVDRVVADAAGIPLFAEEITSMLLESNSLIRRDGKFELVVPIERLDVPVTLQDSLMARLDRVSAAKRVAQVGAVIGHEFDHRLIEEVGHLDSELVREGLAHLVADQLLVQHGESAEPSYSFRHALIQEAAYGTLLKRARKSVHANTAQALDRAVKRGELEISESVIARHYELGECVPQAVACYREAAEESARRAGYQEAAQHLTRAVELLAQQPGPRELERRCGVLISLGHALWNAGEFEPAQNAFLEAAEIAQQVDLPEQLARAALGYGGRTAFGTGFRDEALIALLKEALKRLGDDRVALRAQVTARLSEAITFSEPRERRKALCAQALGTARALGDARTIASVLAHEHWSLWSPDNLARRLDLSREIVSLAKRTQDRVLEAEGRLWLVTDLMEASEMEAAEREFQLMEAVAQELRQHYQLWTLSVLEAMRALKRGAIEEAERLATQALEIGQRDRNQNAVQLFGVQLAGIRREQGRYQELEEPLKIFVEQYTAIPTWRCALTFLYAEAGREDDARRELDVLAAGRFAAFDKDHFWLPDMTLAADASVLLGDHERAATLYEQLLAYRRRCVMCGPIAACWGSTSRTLGSLARVLELWDQAEVHFEEAVEHNRALGAQLWLARTRLEYAEMLLGRATRDDRARALALLDHVTASARELSLTDLDHKALSLRRRARACPQPSYQGTGEGLADCA
jgi:class 3 adenylate cyclase/tetratricopeptide (TPR) repeat protein